MCHYYEAAEMALIDTEVRRTFATGIAGFSHVVDSISAIKYAKVKTIRDEDGLVLKNLYVAGIDSIDQGSGDSSTSTDVSDFCIVIKKRIYGLQEAKYVAIYKDRPRDIREAYDVAMKLLV